MIEDKLFNKCPCCGACEDQQFTTLITMDDPQGKPFPYCFKVVLCECDAIGKVQIWKGKYQDVWISPGNKIKRIDNVP